MTYTPIAEGSLNWDDPVNAAFTSQDARISALEASAPAASDHGLMAWTYDPVAGPNTSVLTSGTVYMAKLKVTVADTTENVYYQVTTAGGTLTAGQNFVALYNQAGTRVALSADQTTAWGTSGFKTTPWTAPAALTVGNYYLAFLTNGTTGITIARGSAHSSEMLSPLQSAANLRWSSGGTGLTGLTALPTSITMANRGTGATSIWAAIS